MKKLLAVTISAMMVMTMVPSMAFANVAGTPDASEGNTDTSTEQKAETTTPTQPEVKVPTTLPDPDKATGEITLTSDVHLANTCVFKSGTHVINLGGFNIIADGKRAIHLESGSLTIKGSGTVSSTNITDPTKSVIRIGDNNASDGANLVIEKDVIIDAPSSYGVSAFGCKKETVTVKGTINAGPRAAVSGNGSDETGADIFVEPTAKLKSDQYAGIYNPQNGKLTINGGEITGLSGIEMKSGSLELVGNPIIKATGDKQHHSTPQEDGRTTSGYAIAITKKAGYQPYSSNIDLSKGSFTGAVGVVNDSGTTTQDDKKMLAVTGGSYNDLEGSLEYITNTADIKISLDKDYKNLSKGLNIKGKVDLELNGFTIESTDEAAICVLKGSSLTVSDSSSGKTGAIIGDAVGIKMGVKEENNQLANSTLVINGGNISGKAFGVSGNGLRHGTTITVNGGKIVGTDAADSLGIYHPQDGKLVINGGEITGTSGIEVRSGSLEVNGGTITGTATNVTADPNGNGSTTKGAGIAIAQHTTQKPISVTVNGGKVSGAVAVNHSNPQNNPDESASKIDIAIKGGEFIATEEGKAPIVSDKTGIVSGGSFSKPVDNSLLAGGVVQDSNGNVYVPSYGGVVAPADPMENVKKDAVSALEGFVKLENYDADEQAVIKSLVEKAKAEISKATTKEAIAKIEADVKAEIAKVKTTADKVLDQKISGVKEIKLYAKAKAIKTKSGKKVIKLAWKAKSGDITKLDGVQVFRSTKGKVGTFKKVYTGKNGKFINKSVVKEQKYFYKVRGFAKIDGKTYYTKFSVKKVGRV